MTAEMILRTAMEEVYRCDFVEGAYTQEQLEIALGVLWDARKYIHGSLYSDGPYAADAKWNAQTGYYTELHFELAKQIKAAIAGKPICCDCASTPCACD